MRREVARQARGVLGGLGLDTRQGPFRFCLDRSKSFAIDVQQVIGESKPWFHLELAHRDSAARREIQLVAALYKPTSGSQFFVDFASGSRSGVSGIRMDWGM